APPPAVPLPPAVAPPPAPASSFETGGEHPSINAQQSRAPRMAPPCHLLKRPDRPLSRGFVMRVCLAVLLVVGCGPNTVANLTTDPELDHVVSVPLVDLRADA